MINPFNFLNYFTEARARPAQHKTHVEALEIYEGRKLENERGLQGVKITSQMLQSKLFLCKAW